jgi:hypothetical protein
MGRGERCEQSKRVVKAVAQGYEQAQARLDELKAK